jgi:hypothetical protein
LTIFREKKQRLFEPSTIDLTSKVAFLFSVYEIRTKGDGSSVFFFVATWRFKKNKKNSETRDFKVFLLPFFGIKLIKLSICRPRLFLGQHLLQQHFGEMLQPT